MEDVVADSSYSIFMSGQKMERIVGRKREQVTVISNAIKASEQPKIPNK